MPSTRFRYTIGAVLLTTAWFGVALGAYHYASAPIFIIWSLVVALAILATWPKAP
jgi:hypothetical protein